MSSNACLPQATTTTRKQQQQQQHRNSRGRPKAAPAVGRDETPRPGCSVCETGAPNYKCPQCRAIYCSIACCRKHKQELCAATAVSNNHNNNPAVANGETTTNNNNEVTTNGAAAPRTVRSKYLSDSELQKLLDQQTRAGSSRKRPRDDHGSDEPGWSLTSDMIQSLRDSAWLREELQDDPGLRHWVSHIAHASNVCSGNSSNNSKQSAAATTPQERLLQETINPSLRQFLDKLLVVAGVLERPADDHTDLEEWLRAPTSHSSRQQLQLKSLPQRRVAAVAAASLEKQEQAPSSSTSDSSSSTEDDDDDDNDNSV